MSETHSAVRSGDFATSRRGGIDKTEMAFIADKLMGGVSIQTVARMIGRPASDVGLVAAGLPRGERRDYKPPKPMVYFPYGGSVEMREIERIAREVAAAYRLTLSDLKGESRLRQVAWPRQEAVWRAHQTGQYASTQIGIYFGGRDHATVFHAIKRVNERLDKCLAQAGFVAQLGGLPE